MNEEIKMDLEIIAEERVRCLDRCLKKSKLLFPEYPKEISEDLVLLWADILNRYFPTEICNAFYEYWRTKEKWPSPAAINIILNRGISFDIRDVF